MEQPRGARLLHKLLVLYQRVALYSAALDAAETYDSIGLPDRKQTWLVDEQTGFEVTVDCAGMNPHTPWLDPATRPRDMRSHSIGV